MVELLGLVFWLKGDVHTQLLEKVRVYMGEDDRRMGLAAPQLVQLIDGIARHGIGHGADGQGDEQLVGMKPGIAVSQVLNFQMLYGLNNAWSDQKQLFVDTGQRFQGVHQAG